MFFFIILFFFFRGSDKLQCAIYYAIDGDQVDILELLAQQVFKLIQFIYKKDLILAFNASVMDYKLTNKSPPPTIFILNQILILFT